MVPKKQDRKIVYHPKVSARMLAIAANTAAVAAGGLKATARSRALAAMAATSATRADCFVHAWRDRKWLTQEEYPSAPSSLEEMYETHLAIQQHPLVASEFGGHAGYKLGAIGAEGEPCLYAPLFNSYMVAAPGDGLSAASINLWQLEPEIGFVMGADLPVRADGAPHTAAAAAAAVSKVVLCIELCGKRVRPQPTYALALALPPSCRRSRSNGHSRSTCPFPAPGPALITIPNPNVSTPLLPRPQPHPHLKSPPTLPHPHPHPHPRLCQRTPEADVKGLGSYADTLSSGGVVMGPSLAAAGISLDQARGSPTPAPHPNPIHTLTPTPISLDQMRCATELLVNGERVAQGSGAEAPLGGPAEAPGPTSNSPTRPGPTSHSPSPSCSPSPIPNPSPCQTTSLLAFPPAARR